MARQYAGFNLLVGDRHSLWYYTNSNASGPRELTPGIYGLSNARLDTPWPKVVRTRERVRTALAAARVSPAALFAALQDREPAADAVAVAEHVVHGGAQAGATVAAYKSLAHVERAFRSMKTIDLHVRPVFHYSEQRVRAHYRVKLPRVFVNVTVPTARKSSALTRSTHAVHRRARRCEEPMRMLRG